jgi:glycosyltransferase involved in cell wall biosynthesis
MKNGVLPASRGLSHWRHLVPVPENARRRRTGLLRAVHVVAGLDPAFGGTSYCVPRLCEALAVAGAGITLLSVASVHGTCLDVSNNGYQDRRFTWDYAHVPILKRPHISSDLSEALHDTALTADVIHNHGLWLMPNAQAGWAAGRARKPLVISPHGMLAPAALGFSPVKKSVFWALFQGRILRDAACLHATSQQEYEEFRALGLTNPVAVIPNGIDIPDRLADDAARPVTERAVLSLGRIHPKKGLDRLVHAWSKVEPLYPSWRLKVIGVPAAGHDAELRALAAALGVTRVSIGGPIYGDAKTAAYREADLFVLSSLNENFGLTVAEALAAGTPAISTKGAPWSGLEREGCGWWIDHGAEPLTAALAQAMALPREALRAMGEKGREWMARDFSWDRVASDMLDVYLWLARSGELPSIVRLD